MSDDKPTIRPDRAREASDEVFATPAEHRLGMLKRRREKIVAEIERNRRGDHKVPTWVLTAVLVAVVVAFAALVIFTGN